MIFEFDTLKQKLTKGSSKKKSAAVKQSPVKGGSTKKTFLGVDSILYPAPQPQATKQPVDSTTKAKRKTIKADPSDQNVPGLKGYPASGKRIYSMMNEERARQMQS